MICFQIKLIGISIRSAFATERLSDSAAWNPRITPRTTNSPFSAGGAPRKHGMCDPVSASKLKLERAAICRPRQLPRNLQAACSDTLQQTIGRAMFLKGSAGSQDHSTPPEILVLVGCMDLAQTRLLQGYEVHH